jgi:primary-amine oxidase
VVSEVDVLPMGKGPKNPHGNGFYAQETDLNTTTEAQRKIAPELGRIWKIKNPGVLNPMSGAPVAYKLMPAAGPGLLATEDSVIAKRGVFASKNLWVTPHDDTERFPAGEYVLQSEECRGLKLWTQQEKSLTDADPVIWYSFGVTHIVRVEDFPVMPVETIGFHLKPFGFFSGNPGLDIPPTKNAASKLAGANGATCCSNGANGTNGIAATNGDHTSMASVEATNGTAMH